MQPAYYIKTYGCQMNAYDSGRMDDIFLAQGYQLASTIEQADVVVLNTCHIREKASQKLYSEVGRIRANRAKLAKESPQTTIVAGCVAQAEGEEIMRRAPSVDFVLGPQAFQQLGNVLDSLHKKDVHSPRVIRDFLAQEKFDDLPRQSRPSGVSAFLTIQEGCDKFCSFCVVPYTRGAEFSRPPGDIIAEARQLIANGARELTLLGQNVNAYCANGPNGKPWSLARLIREMGDLDGLLRLRYMTSHPRDMDDDLIRAHADVPQLMPYLHLPVQSGSDRILAAMNRKHSADEYRKIIDALRHHCPDIALSSDFIVGFPGESNDDFADTLGLVNDVTFAQAYSFKYSTRPGTPAANAQLQVPEEEKISRLHRLQQLLNAQQKCFNQAMIGRQIDVLFEKPGRDKGQWVGRSPWLQPVHLDSDHDLTGQLVKCTITKMHGFSLFATKQPAIHD